MIAFARQKRVNARSARAESLSASTSNFHGGHRFSKVGGRDAAAFQGGIGPAAEPSSSLRHEMEARTVTGLIGTTAMIRRGPDLVSLVWADSRAESLQVPEFR
jgi:hypothetical protein